MHIPRGYLPVDEVDGSHHCLLSLDLDVTKYFHGVTDNPISPKTRSFTTKNKKRADPFQPLATNEPTRKLAISTD